MEKEKKSIKSRITDASLKQWIKFSVVTIILIFFVCWLGNAWWLLLLPLIFDIYISKFVPWGAWKHAKNPTVRKIAEWVDAILFALVAVYLINTFFFQNYKIPSASLEKTLMTGDFLFVSKVAYGPRTPMTPFSFPLTQHTFPIINTKSYIEKPQLKYKRLKGFRDIELNDIVVFNFPTGDTVPLLIDNPNYYESCFLEGYVFYRDYLPGTEPSTEDCMREGRRIITTLKKNEYGDIVYRPVDRRENFVKRCVALPGDTLQIINNQVYVNGQKQADIPGLQLAYFVETNGQYFSQKTFVDLGITIEPGMLMNNRPNGNYILEQEGFERNADGSFNPIYRVPLTAEMLPVIQRITAVKQVKLESDKHTGVTFPLGNGVWTRDNYGPLWIPKKGMTEPLNLSNLPLYERIITAYEGNKLEVKDNTIYINGEKADTYTFGMDYYWMMGDNRHNSADSRSWGFVPEDHIVGQPVFIWLSLDKDKGLFDGKIRFNRFFKSAKK